MPKVVKPTRPSVGGMFSGIGGLELGFHRAGFESRFLCEVDGDAQRVLTARFPKTKIFEDVATMKALPAVTALTAGFPCQDLSAVGTRIGIEGARSGLVGRLFELVAEAGDMAPEWIVLENVPFMLQLKKGSAMTSVTRRLDELAYNWAYRVIDSRAFGLPQRRRRVFIVATRGTIDPCRVLFADDARFDEPVESVGLARGFYWTEGNRGLGWALDAVPTLKGGSSLSIPSPPAIWMPDDTIQLPDIRDAERLQGFNSDWTEPTEADDESRRRRRWRQVGNAVSVPAAQWVAERIVNPGEFDEMKLRDMPAKGWPMAACKTPKGVRAVNVTEFPVAIARPHLHEFLQFPTTAISTRAARGFYSRIAKSGLRLEPGFLEAVAHAAGMDRRLARRAPVVKTTNLPQGDSSVGLNEAA